MKKAMILVAGAFFLTFIFSPVLAQQKTKEKNPFASSQVCAQCHLEIYNSWKNSMHASSLNDPIFEAAYLEALRDSPTRAKALCLRCHAPTVTITRDYDLAQEVSQEGIICDFCHTVSRVDLANPSNPFVSRPGEVKWGPFKDSVSPGHKTEYSEIFEKSTLCAGCHEYKNPRGVTILGTYSEWKQGPYAAEGKECQSCHMPRTPGRIAVSGVKAPERGFINLHYAPGGRSIEQLRKTIKLQITELKRTADTLTVGVNLTNVGAGHLVPTGLPTRKLILKVIVETSTGQTMLQEVVYQKALADDEGKAVTRDSRIFTDPVRLIKDNRLAPRETRKEQFSFNLRSEVKTKVRAELHYSYSPLVLQPVDMDAVMASEEKDVPARGFFFK